MIFKKYYDRHLFLKQGQSFIKSIRPFQTTMNPSDAMKFYGWNIWFYEWYLNNIVKQPVKRGSKGISLVTVIDAGIESEIK